MNLEKVDLSMLGTCKKVFFESLTDVDVVALSMKFDQHILVG